MTQGEVVVSEIMTIDKQVKEEENLRSNRLLMVIIVQVWQCVCLAILQCWYSND